MPVSWRLTPSRRLLRAAGVAACALWLAPTAQAQADTVGAVKTVAGAAFVVRGGRVLPARPGLALLQSDSLRTGSDGRLGLTLRDETRLSLGPSSTVLLAKFAYDPATARLGLTLRILRGIADYVSGRIAALAPGAVSIETPSSIIGVRGTHLLIQVEAP